MTGEPGSAYAGEVAVTKLRFELYPLAGALIGAAGGALFLTARPILGAFLAAGLWALFAITFEHPRTNPVLIAIAAGSLLRWWTLTQLATPRIVAVCVLVHTVSRASTVGLAWMSRPAANGSASYLSVSTRWALLAIAEGIAASFLLGWHDAIVVLVVGYSLVRGARWFAYSHRSGLDDESLAISEQVFECALLGIFACTDCRF